MLFKAANIAMCKGNKSLILKDSPKEAALQRLRKIEQ
jgi:hypothetical protein